MDKILDDISKNIKKYRKANKMTQKDLAEKVGVSIAAVSNWETGTNSIDIDSLFKVCKALNVPISLMTMTSPDIELSDVEIELVERFRSAEDWQRKAVIKMLDMKIIPQHLLTYSRLIKMHTESQNN